MINYHESLDICISTLIDGGVTLGDDVLIVRDASGRLTVCLADKALAAAVARPLSEALGGYAASPVAISGHIASTLMSDPAARPVERLFNGSSVLFRYLDRRIVGADWLSAPDEITQRSKRRVVFASLKGGVGRTTALTVAAAHFAGQGQRVLAIDLDLEAPGIGSMLLPAKSKDGVDQRPRFGVIDYLLEEQLQNISESDLVNFVGVSPFEGGSIDVVPAVGRETEERPAEFIQKLSRALTEGVKDGHLIPFYRKVCGLVDRFEKFGNYDLILIDARAGIAEITAAPLTKLGASVLLFATDQQQTFMGYRYLLSHMSSQTDFSVITRETDWRNSLTFVQSKAPSSERQRLSFRDKVYELCAQWLYEDSNSSDAFNFTLDETGYFVPHDATYIRSDPAFEAFDPTIIADQLDKEVYAPTFDPILNRISQLTGIGNVSDA
jgi:Mrp family chromosome partitioning ATPase